jgi:hypothetical protein
MNPRYESSEAWCKDGSWMDCWDINRKCENPGIKQIKWVFRSKDTISPNAPAPSTMTHRTIADIVRASLLCNPNCQTTCNINVIDKKIFKFGFWQHYPGRPKFKLLLRRWVFDHFRFGLTQIGPIWVRPKVDPNCPVHLDATFEQLSSHFNNFFSKTLLILWSIAADTLAQ